MKSTIYKWSRYYLQYSPIWKQLTSNNQFNQINSIPHNNHHKNNLQKIHDNTHNTQNAHNTHSTKIDKNMKETDLNQKQQQKNRQTQQSNDQKQHLKHLKHLNQLVQANYRIKIAYQLVLNQNKNENKLSYQTNQNPSSSKHQSNSKSNLKNKNQQQHHHHQQQITKYYKRYQQNLKAIIRYITDDDNKQYSDKCNSNYSNSNINNKINSNLNNNNNHINTYINYYVQAIENLIIDDDGNNENGNIGEQQQIEQYNNHIHNHNKQLHNHQTQKSTYYKKRTIYKVDQLKKRILVNSFYSQINIKLKQLQNKLYLCQQYQQDQYLKHITIKLQQQDLLYRIDQINTLIIVLTKVINSSLKNLFNKRQYEQQKQNKQKKQKKQKKQMKQQKQQKNIQQYKIDEQEAIDWILVIDKQNTQLVERLGQAVQENFQRMMMTYDKCQLQYKNQSNSQQNHYNNIKSNKQSSTSHTPTTLSFNSYSLLLHLFTSYKQLKSTLQILSKQLSLLKIQEKYKLMSITVPTPVPISISLPRVNRLFEQFYPIYQTIGEIMKVKDLVEIYNYHDTQGNLKNNQNNQNNHNNQDNQDNQNSQNDHKQAFLNIEKQIKTIINDYLLKSKALYQNYQNKQWLDNNKQAKYNMESRQIKESRNLHKIMENKQYQSNQYSKINKINKKIYSKNDLIFCLWKLRYSIECLENLKLLSQNNKYNKQLNRIIINLISKSNQNNQRSNRKQLATNNIQPMKSSRSSRSNRSIQSLNQVNQIPLISPAQSSSPIPSPTSIQQIQQKLSQTISNQINILIQQIYNYIQPKILSILNKNKSNSRNSRNSRNNNRNSRNDNGNDNGNDNRNDNKKQLQEQQEKLQLNEIICLYSLIDQLMQMISSLNSINTSNSNSITTINNKYNKPQPQTSLPIQIQNYTLTILVRLKQQFEQLILKYQFTQSNKINRNNINNNNINNNNIYNYNYQLSLYTLYSVIFKYNLTLEQLSTGCMMNLIDKLFKILYQQLVKQNKYIILQPREKQYLIRVIDWLLDGKEEKKDQFKIKQKEYKKESEIGKVKGKQNEKEKQKEKKKQKGNIYFQQTLTQYNCKILKQIKVKIK